MRFDPIAFLEAVHSSALDDKAWLERLTASARGLDQGQGVIALLADASRPDALNVLEYATPPAMRGYFGRVIEDVKGSPPGWIEAAYTFGADLLSRKDRSYRFDPPPPVKEEDPAQDFDALGIVGTDPSRIGCVVFAPVPRGHRPGPRRLHVLRKVAAHLASAGRLRVNSLGRSRPRAAPEAIFDPGGRVVDAAPLVHEKGLREEFRTRIRSIEKARGRMRRTHPDEALELWSGMVSGEWSLVEIEERDGKRFLLAKRNPPNVAKHFALSNIEATVAAYVALGHSTKFIAYELGLAASTVSTHVRSVLAKLNLGSRAELARLFAGVRPAPMLQQKARAPRS